MSSRTFFTKRYYTCGHCNEKRTVRSRVQVMSTVPVWSRVQVLSTVPERSRVQVMSTVPVKSKVR